MSDAETADVTDNQDTPPVDGADDAAKVVEPTTISSGDDDKQAVAPADWPEDWRQKLAGDDERLSKRLERMNSPADVLKSWRALEQKQSTGELKTVLPEGATDEQVAEYREANGIPTEPKGYLEKLPDGVIIGENDQDMVNGFLDAMHEQNASPELVGKSIEWFYSRQEQAVAALHEEDNAFKADAEETLRAEWGGEYKDNIKAFESFIDTAPESIRDLIRTGRLADGSVIGNNPDVLKWFSAMSKEINPAATVVPGSAGTSAQSIDDEIAKIEGTMRSDRAAYNKDSAMQDRYMKLLQAKEKMSARAA